MPEKIYQKITPQKWQQIKDAAAGYGITIEGATGEGESFGVKLWCFWSVKQTLTIRILESGLLSPEDALTFVDGIIQGAT